MASAEENDFADLPSGTETILIVEDERAVREVVTQTLIRFGYTVIQAEHGAEALHRVEEHAGPVHLALVDMILPGGMTGAAIADKLLQLRPSLRIIFTSGYSVDSFTPDLPGGCVPGFLQKPFGAVSLIKSVRDYLDG